MKEKQKNENLECGRELPVTALNLLQGKCFHNQQNAENDFQEFIES